MSTASRHPNPIRRTHRHRDPAAPALTAFRLGMLLSLALAAAPARAEAPLEDRYQGRGDGRVDLQMFEFGDGSGARFVITGTAIPNECTGELRGLAKTGSAGALVLSLKDKGSDEACTLPCASARTASACA